MIEFSQGFAPFLWPRKQSHALPTRHESLSILLYSTGFRKWVGPLAIKWSAWTRPLFSPSKYHLSLYEKMREDGLISDHLNGPNDTFIVHFSTITSVYFAITEQGMERLKFDRMFFCLWNVQCSPLRRCIYGAYTNHHLSVLQYWLFSWIYRKHLGSIWMFNAPRSQRHKNRCITLS